MKRIVNVCEQLVFHVYVPLVFQGINYKSCLSLFGAVQNIETFLVTYQNIREMTGIFPSLYIHFRKPIKKDMLHIHLKCSPRGRLNILKPEGDNGCCGRNCKILINKMNYCSIFL